MAEPSYHKRAAPFIGDVNLQLGNVAELAVEGEIAGRRVERRDSECLPKQDQVIGEQAREQLVNLEPVAPAAVIPLPQQDDANNLKPWLADGAYREFTRAPIEDFAIFKEQFKQLEPVRQILENDQENAFVSQELKNRVSAYIVHLKKLVKSRGRLTAQLSDLEKNAPNAAAFFRGLGELYYGRGGHECYQLLMKLHALSEAILSSDEISVCQAFVPINFHHTRCVMSSFRDSFQTLSEKIREFPEAASLLREVAQLYRGGLDIFHLANRQDLID